MTNTFHNIKVFYVTRFEQFPNSDLLWKEVASFTDALEGEVMDQHRKFLTGKEY